MKKRNGDPVPPDMLEQVRELEALRDEDIDLSDTPQTPDWSNAVQGKYYRPIKKPYSLRLDEDIVAWFKSRGSGYQTRINAALREYVISQTKTRA
jgi:uncharacterized protein (DUF4415 family)